jgi:hypothetical protein
MVWINSSNDSDFRIPFGGVKQSGIGRELGEAGLEAYTNKKVREAAPRSDTLLTTTGCSRQSWHEVVGERGEQRGELGGNRSRVGAAQYTQNIGTFANVVSGRDTIAFPVAVVPSPCCRVHPLAPRLGALEHLERSRGLWTGSNIPINEDLLVS